jgi:hypothetical protein
MDGRNNDAVADFWGFTRETGHRMGRFS